MRVAGLGQALSEGRLKALFDAAITRALAGGRLLIPLALACECPVSTSDEVITRPLTDSEAASLGLQAVAGEPLSAATCEALCAKSFRQSGPVVSCRVARYGHARSTGGSDAASASDTEAGSGTAAEPAGALTLECTVPVTTDCGGVGRWTSGARLASRPKGGAPSYFADAAGFERVAVTAFRELERDLDRLHAPLTLRQRARRARRDEVRHVRVMSSEGARRCASPRPTAVASRPRRSLLELALENAVYGCVEESWGALLLMAQSELAAEPRMRRIFRRLGREELSHAALAWDLHRWACARLPAEARQQVEATLRRAAAARVAAAEPSLSPEESRYVGLLAKARTVPHTYAP